MLYVHCKMDVEFDTSAQEQVSTESGTVLKIDLGVNNLAVVSTGTVWTGNEFDRWRQEYENRRGDLQQCGTWWAHENAQSVGHKQESRYKITLYPISNELVAEAREYGYSLIAFEDLTDIRERTGVSWGDKWAFNRLYQYVEYKAEGYGLTIEQVAPANTSRRCSECGFTYPANRESELFECLKCSYENHADYNASKNIGLRYLRRNQTRGDEGAPAVVQLNSGMVTVNGEYEPPVEVSVGAEVHAESPPVQKWVSLPGWHNTECTHDCNYVGGKTGPAQIRTAVTATRRPKDTKLPHRPVFRQRIVACLTVLFADLVGTV